MRLADVRRRLWEWDRQEGLLLDVIEYAEAADDPAAHFLEAVAYLELGSTYAETNRETLSEQAYEKGLELLDGVPEDVINGGGEVEGRRAVSVERLSRLVGTAQSTDN
jgi:hypothetical protein